MKEQAAAGKIGYYELGAIGQYCDNLKLNIINPFFCVQLLYFYTIKQTKNLNDVEQSNFYSPDNSFSKCFIRPTSSKTKPRFVYSRRLFLLRFGMLRKHRFQNTQHRQVCSRRNPFHKRISGCAYVFANTS